MEPTELQSNANDLIEQIDMQHSRHMRLSALVDYQLRYPDMTIKEFFSMAAQELRDQEEEEEDWMLDIIVLTITLVDLINTFFKDPDPGIINLLLTPGEELEPFAFHLIQTGSTLSLFEYFIEYTCLSTNVLSSTSAPVTESSFICSPLILPAIDGFLYTLVDSVVDRGSRFNRCTLLSLFSPAVDQHFYNII